jgi:DNA-directed RNA polymerase subunit K/omega
MVDESTGADPIRDAHAHADADAGAAAESDAGLAAPITSRFLFVDVAAQRAKQLRRGALPRVERHASGPHKLERLAMEEVRRQVISYTVPTGYDGKGTPS